MTGVFLGTGGVLFGFAAIQTVRVCRRLLRPRPVDALADLSFSIHTLSMQVYALSFAAGGLLCVLMARMTR